jgi:transposase
MTQPIVGIDVAKATFDVALPLERPGKYRTKAKLPNTPAGFAEVLKWLRQHAAEAAVCLEATGIYHEALATTLVEHGVTVYVVNPAQVAAYAKSELARTKTDRYDAKLIARFAMAQQVHQKLRPWVPPTPGQRQLRALVHRLNDLQTMRQMEANRLAVGDASVRPSIQRLIATLDTQVEALKQAIRDHIDQDPDLRRDHTLLSSIPGIGELTAAFIQGFAGRLQRFDDPRQLDAFAGLNPAIRQSGRWAGQSRLSKLGHALLRAKLYMPALVAIRHNVAVRALFDRLLDRGKPPKLALGAAMRKLLHIAWGVVRSGSPFNAGRALARG